MWQISLYINSFFSLWMKSNKDKIEEILRDVVTKRAVYLKTSQMVFFVILVWNWLSEMGLLKTV